MDNLYPTTPTAPYMPTPPVEQVIEQEKEVQKMAMSAPIIEDLLADFDRDIADCSNIDSLSLTSEATIKEQVMALKRLKKLLQEKRAKYAAKYENYKGANSEL